MTSMLPVVTLNVFGYKRGTQVYGYMYSVFGLAAMSGTLIVDTLQHKIGYSGMLIVCLFFTGTAAAFTYFYQFDIPLSYSKLSKEATNFKEMNEESEKGTTESLLKKE